MINKPPANDQANKGNTSTSDLQEFIRSGIPGMDFSPVTRYMGLPASADALVNARPASAVPGLDGDETVVYSRIK